MGAAGREDEGVGFGEVADGGKHVGGAVGDVGHSGLEGGMRGGMRVCRMVSGMRVIMMM